MRRFITKILILAIGWLLPLYLLQAVYDHAAYQDYYKWPYEKINTAYNRQQNANLIILGNSRGAGNYVPEVMESLLGMKCCNLSLSGYTFDFDYHMVFQPYMERNIAPQYIVQDVSPWAFFQDVNPSYAIEFLPYINRPEFDFYINRCAELSVFDKYLPLKYHGQLVKCYENYKSFIAKEADKSERKYYMKDYFGDAFYPIEKDPALLDLFSQYLKDCKARHIQVAIVCSPIHVVDGNAHFNIKGFREQLKDISHKEGVPFLDYSELYGADTLYFIDPVHLKVDAQKLFSQKVASDLKEMGWSLNETLR